MTIFTLSGCDF